MTMIPTPTDIAESQRQMDEITIRVGEQRITLLETLIQKYAAHVGACEGVSFLESHYQGSGMGLDSEDEFTDEEWVEIRRIAEEPE